MPHNFYNKKDFIIEVFFDGDCKVLSGDVNTLLKINSKDIGIWGIK